VLAVLFTLTLFSFERIRSADIGRLILDVGYSKHCIISLFSENCTEEKVKNGTGLWAQGLGLNTKSQGPKTMRQT
jgi:hypothetical protein